MFIRILILVSLLFFALVCIDSQTTEETIKAANPNRKSQFKKAKGEWINARNDAGNTVLMEAAKYGNYDSVKELIDRGSDLKLKDNDENTPLLLAVKFGHYLCTDELIKSGSDIKHENIFGMTALLIAAHAPHEDLIPLLLSLGANANEKTPEAFTVLMLAAQNANSATTIKELLRYGADAGIVSDTGQTALMFAAASGNIENVEVFDALLTGEESKDCINIDARDASGMTALLIATHRGKYKVVQRLIEHGANLNLLDDYGRSALEHAVYEQYQDIADLLVEHGIDLPLSGWRVSQGVLEKRQKKIDSKRKR